MAVQQPAVGTGDHKRAGTGSFVKDTSQMSQGYTAYLRPIGGQGVLKGTVVCSKLKLVQCSAHKMVREHTTR
jgi:hypothetical protein